MYCALSYRFALVGSGVPNWWREALADLAVDVRGPENMTSYGIDAADGERLQLTRRVESGAKTVVLTSGRDDDLLDALIHDVRRRAMDERAHVVVHASAVRRGRTTVLMPGSSGAGKSTVAVLLGRRGWSYLGDEMIGVDPAGHLLECPTPPRLAADVRAALGVANGDSAPKRFVPLRQVAPESRPPDGTPATQTAVVLLERARERTTMERIPRTEGLAVLADAVFAGTAAASAFAAIAALARAAHFYRLAARTAAEAAEAIHSVVST